VGPRPHRAPRPGVDAAARPVDRLARPRDLTSDLTSDPIPGPPPRTARRTGAYPGQ
jgi:hypothetical protein